MADNSPVCDVLYEATDYLTKLGSNLRIRSESLKQKRIRRDKLKNTHALQKAANKVLLICELSKKSLENVENGVKNMLRLVDVAQRPSSSGGKSPNTSFINKKTHNLKSKLFFKVPININLAHYKSVKVLAKQLPAAMLRNYPVYYDCKLYRMRKRIKSKDNDDSLKNDLDISKKSESKKLERQNSVKSDVDTVEISENKLVHSENVEEGKNSKANVKTADENTESVHSSKVPDSEKSEKKDVNNTSCDTKEKKHDMDEGKTKSPINKQRNNNNSDKPKVSDSENEINKRHSKKNKKCKRKRVINYSSDSDSTSHQSNTEQKGSNAIDLACDDGGKVESNLLCDENKESNVIKLDTEEIDKEKETTVGIANAENSDINLESSKPLIKCVNINKLLKPDVQVAENTKHNHQFCTSPANIIVSMNRSGEVQSKILNQSLQEKVGCKKSIFSRIQKIKALNKKKVDAFSPKDFVIDVVRLPKLSIAFLHKYNLSKIIQDGNVVCEVHSQEHVNNLETLPTKGFDSSNQKDLATPVKEAKNALLNDSDGEKSDSFPTGNLTQETENIKNSLLHSESDSNEETVDQNTLLQYSDEENSSSHLKDIVSQEMHNAENSDHFKEQKEQDTATASPLNQTHLESSEKSVQNVATALSHTSNAETSETLPTTSLSQETLKVKNSLLHSESDDNDEQEKQETQKQSLKNPEEEIAEPQNSIDSTLEKYTNELQSEIQKLSRSSPDNQLAFATNDKDKELAESPLLNDSSGIGSSSIKSFEKKTESATPSRRKHIMESMHAKRMLLTYSSSSDTDDEQLKKVIKNIKDSLLKNMDSDEENTQNGKKKMHSSSDSDDNILDRAKKKRKKQHETGRDLENKEVESGSHEDSMDKIPKSRFSKMGRSREKPGGSSSPNSDPQDEKDIKGLTNMKSLTKSRRRRDSDCDKANTSTKKDKASKPSLITGEGLLEAPSSSDEVSSAESEAAEEDLPPISLSGLNGSGVEHLAKDDLLGDSESDSSKDKSDVKKDDSDTDNVKAKRRKANAISSDSEAGSSRKKENQNARLSDFEDSEDESSEPMKRNKRKKGTDSDASAGSSSDGEKKKRRRIKQINDSDASGSDTENEGKSKHGRKNIRKVMGKNQLEEATKKAAREEKERLARIAERQKTYNNLEFDESGKPDEVILDKVVLDFDPETKEPLIEVDRGLVKKLKPHQANGIKFMWDACFESVKRIKKDRGSGCILAHCMGLGKTLQVVSLTHTLLTHTNLTGVNRVLVVCPLSTVLNWVNEFRMWLKHAERDYEVDVYELSRYKQNSERAFQLSQWFQHGGVCVLGYEMFRNLSADNVKKFKKKMLRQFQESLVDPGPDLVVCDEGHLLKNEKTSLSQSMNRVKTRRRIVLTGTPLQNNLKEYYCMVQFVKPNLLGKYNEYLNRFVNPITNGQYTDSTEHDIRVMKRRSHVLHKMLDGAVQRRDYGVLAPFLPPKHEYVLFITLTEVQIKLYQHYLDNYSRRPLPGKSSGFLFPDFQSLQRIWTHPLVLKYNSERYEIMQQKKREREEEDSEGSLVDFIDDDSTPDETSTEESSDDLSDMSDDSRKKSKKKKSPKKGKTKDSKGAPARRGTRANPVEIDEQDPDPDIIEVKNENPTEWWISMVEEEEVEDLRNSHKLVLLFEILRQCEAIGDKLLVFSQSLYSLDLIEHFLGKVDEATQEGRIDEKLNGHVGSWSPGVDYFRLDGSTSCENRSIWCKNFNREDNPRARLFLISTRAGGLGINLVAANRVVIFDVSWNPSHDVQSIFRVYRFGQKKPCYIYRFLAMGTMEEKIYERQVTKQAISKRVIDEQQIDRHYAENDLAELYKFEPRPPAPRPVPLVPKDRFFAEMLKEHEALIYKFHEHDSLLENKEEETLSEEERKAAWEDFENEKNRPPPAPFPSWPMHNGMMPNLLAQQQQQLAYAALAQMLRKDMPNLSDENIRNMLPIIYGTNPGMFGGYDYGLMQKLSDMYKYGQPGMMNPAMMNPVMNAGGAPTGGMGGGGTSGLQYEPPWQRQQQQQQQMRLQQLMQQQNQMGAKFYAGGLGSRDPVAMALQQQRAREIMLGNAASAAAARPRGRPPLAPRQPATTSADVVNLDSD